MHRQWRAIVLTLGIALVWPMVTEAQWVWTPETKRFVNMKRMPKATAELQVEYARTLLASGAHKNALKETNRFEEFYYGAEESDENQFLRGEIKLSQSEYVSAAKEFQLVVDNYPETDLYDDVIEKQYEIGDTFFEKGQRKAGRHKWYRLFKKRPFKRAAEVYAMVIDNKPFTEEAAQAQYKVGRCGFVRGEYIEAAFEYRRVIEDYADSSYVPDASYGLARCYEESALGPDYDQAPSMLTIDAIDEFSARFPGDARVGDLAEVRVEMRESIARQRLQTARFYERRRLHKSARIYYEVVVEQFSDTEAAGTAQEWLAAHSPTGSGN